MSIETTTLHHFYHSAVNRTNHNGVDFIFVFLYFIFFILIQLIYDKNAEFGLADIYSFSVICSLFYSVISCLRSLSLFILYGVLKIEPSFFFCRKKKLVTPEGKKGKKIGESKEIS